MARLLLPASLTSLFSPLMMMHKPYCPKIMTENLREGLDLGPGVLGAKELRVVRLGIRAMTWVRGCKAKGLCRRFGEIALV